MNKHLAVLLATALASQAALAQTTKKGTTKPATSTTNSASDKITIIQVGDTKVPLREFKYVYNKNNSSADDANSDKSVREYVDLYTNFKLKVMDAERRRMDTAGTFKAELEGYRRQLAQPYLSEKSVTDKLIREAYNRMKEEVRAAHILIQVDRQAAPKDTLKAYNRAMDYRKRVLAGESFEKLAAQVSDDPSAKQNNGDLGYFSSMQMVYPFENAAFTTPKGQVSMPVRTQFGYHIIKVLDKRASQGQVTVAHIMVRANPGMPAEDSVAALNKIKEIYSRLQKGENFGTLALTFSDDPGSKEKGGALPAFSAGNMIPSFEEASFALKDTGSYSQPFQTPYGWHIVKLMGKKPVEAYEEMEPSLKTKVSRDSRSELNRSVLLARLKKENKLVEMPKLKAQVLAKADTSLLSGRWRYKRADKLLNQALFTIKGEKTTVEEFYKYAESSQAPNAKSEPQYLMQLAYNNFVDEQMLKYEDQHLSEKYEDYKMLYKEYRDGILLFSLMDQKVWSKAIEDTTGLKAFYERNKDKYRWETRADAVIYNVADQATLTKVKEGIRSRRYIVNEPKIEDFAFEKNSFNMAAKNTTDIRRIAFALRNDDALKVVVTGVTDKGEKGGTGRKRAKAIADSLIKQGIATDRIEQNIVDKGGSGKKATIAFVSNSFKAFERNLNVQQPLAAQITEGKFQKGDNPVMDKLTWKVGDFTILDDPTGKGRITYAVINAIETPRPKTLDEARGLVISDYQTELEKAWITELRAQNKVIVNETEVQKLINKK